MCFKKIRKMLRRKQPAGTGKRVAIVGTADDLAKLADQASAAVGESPPVAVPPWSRRRVRVIGRGRGGPNMPKRQPCPTCRRGSRRGQKTVGGAYYHCGTHGVFFVLYPRRKAA